MLKGASVSTVSPKTPETRPTIAKSTDGGSRGDDAHDLQTRFRIGSMNKAR
jgi:hypothetical protein